MKVLFTIERLCVYLISDLQNGKIVVGIACDVIVMLKMNKTKSREGRKCENLIINI